MIITINQERLDALIEDFKDSRKGNLSESDDINLFIRGLCGSASPLELPDGAEGVAYYLDGTEDPGFLFALRPRRLDPSRAEFNVNVTGFFTGMNEVWQRTARSTGRVLSVLNPDRPLTSRRAYCSAQICP